MPAVRLCGKGCSSCTSCKAIPTDHHLPFFTWRPAYCWKSRHSIDHVSELGGIGLNVETYPPAQTLLPSQSKGSPEDECRQSCASAEWQRGRKDLPCNQLSDVGPPKERAAAYSLQKINSHVRARRNLLKRYVHPDAEIHHRVDGSDAILRRQSPSWTTLPCPAHAGNITRPGGGTLQSAEVQDLLIVVGYHWDVV